jgi:phosphoglycerate dehydrogenase-like enzyme
MPHIAGEPDAYVERVMEIFADNYRRLAADEPLRNPVDLARGY